MITSSVRQTLARLGFSESVKTQPEVQLYLLIFSTKRDGPRIEQALVRQRHVRRHQERIPHAAEGRRVRHVEVGEFGERAAF